MAGGFNPVLTKVGDGGREVYGATEVGTWQAAFATGDTYTTGGWALTAGQFGLSRPIAGVTVNGYNTAAIVWIWQWNFQTSKLQMLGAGGGAAGTVSFADATSAQSLTGMTIQLFIWTTR
jgi:hypothetical protein